MLVYLAVASPTSISDAGGSAPLGLSILSCFEDFVLMTALSMMASPLMLAKASLSNMPTLVVTLSLFPLLFAYEIFLCHKCV
ncbi:hypothetical protein BVRB_8g184570 [Beta vulgaris subsp. vulgaris]|nr:hypothetical protein BVRB_8g184570 [Beta vulgaris subsp. vulgaris]